jgi:membrane-bound serine protease (ClpP class)
MKHGIKNQNRVGVAAVCWALLAGVAAAPALDRAAGVPSGDVESTGDVTSSLGLVIPIDDDLTDVTVESVRRRIDEAVARGASVIVFELNTPGGLVSSALEIADLIKNLDRSIRTVAWVNTNAHSGGAIVAVACDEIVMARSSRMGTSEVILFTPTGVQGVPEDLKAKANTPVINEYRASARRNGYSEALSEAFVIPDREVWWLENTQTGERRFVFREEKERLLKEEPTSSDSAETDDTATGEAASRATTKAESTTAESTTAGASPSGGAGAAGSKSSTPWKLVERYRDAVYDVDVEVVQPVVSSSELLEVSAGQAIVYGFARGVVNNAEELRERYGLARLEWVLPSTLERLTQWMTSIYVRGFLLVLILLGIYVEFHTPGVGVPGLAALICLAIFVGAPYLTGLANVWEILFIVAGLALLAVEVLVIPGFGVAGITGLVLLFLGLIATFAPDDPGRSFPLYIPSAPDTINALKTGVATVAGSLVVSLLGMFMLARVLPQMTAFRTIVPENPTPEEVQIEDPYRGAARVGDVGVAESSLRPAGKARFGSLLVDVVTQGELVQDGARIEVVERHGNRVVVRALS